MNRAEKIADRAYWEFNDIRNLLLQKLYATEAVNCDITEVKAEIDKINDVKSALSKFMEEGE